MGHRLATQSLKPTAFESVIFLIALAKYVAKAIQERKGLFWLPVEQGAVHYDRNEFRGASLWHFGVLRSKELESESRNQMPSPQAHSMVTIFIQQNLISQRLYDLTKQL